MPKSEAEYTCAVGTGAKAKGLAMRRSPYTDIRGVLNACSGELSFRSQHLYPPSINLLSALLSLAATRDSAAMVCQGGYWQPMFSVLPRRFLSGLVQGWNAGERSLQKALSCEGVAGLECPDGDTR